MNISTHFDRRLDSQHGVVPPECLSRSVAQLDEVIFLEKSLAVWRRPSLELLDHLGQQPFFHLGEKREFLFYFIGRWLTAALPTLGSSGMFISDGASFLPAILSLR